jgi:hypothetical protein
MDCLLRRVGAARLGAWVVNEPAEIARWLDAPVALITTDRPDLFPTSVRTINSPSAFQRP